jgi:hypothetical protein
MKPRYLARQIFREDGSSFHFEVDAFRRHCLLNGLDDIGLTMQKMGEIRAFEAVRSENFPVRGASPTRCSLFSLRMDSVVYGRSA